MSTVLYSNTEIKDVLANNRPVILGLEVFQGFFDIDKENPTVAMPFNYTYSLGGHAVLILGYDDDTKSFLIKNSFGSEWGNNGYAWIPFSYVETYGYEKWCFEINSQKKLN